LDEDGREYIRYAVDGANRMFELINALLSYSRIQTKGKKFEKVDMNYVVELFKRNLSLQIDEKQASVTSDPLPVIMADENQMVQLFQNLVSNSIKFCNCLPKVHISCKDDSEQYIFSVNDNGIGIDENYFGRIFKIFQRLGKREEYEGTGIGLAICKNIVERHGGKIWLESELGKGTTFYFSIPQKENRNNPLS
jgi:light-regulated signal transduction histidine kinase (bacteriophytochrome)